MLIVLDALGAGHVSHLGYERPTTPVIDRLAAEGVSFENALAPAPYTLASAPSLATGRLPDVHGVTNRMASLPDEELTLAELLRGAGYRTLAAFANLNGGPPFGLGQGFDEGIELYMPAEGREIDLVDARTGEEFHVPVASDYPPLVREWLADAGAEQPLFLYLHLLEPHSPYTPPAEYRALFVDPAYDGPLGSGDSATLVQAKQKKLETVSADHAASRALYDANLRWADENLGFVFEALRVAGRYDEALIVVTSDHGESFWQHGTWGHNDQLYEEMLRVPLVVKLPASAVEGSARAGRPLRGVRPQGLASLTDLVPSIAEWLDLPLPSEVDGRSLTPYLFSPDAEPTRELRLRTHHRIPHVGLRTPTHKVIVHRHEQTGETTDVEFYWLDVDPAEANDLFEIRARQAAPYVRGLEEWIFEATVERAERDIPLTRMQENMLEQLGYAEFGED